MPDIKTKQSLKFLCSLSFSLTISLFLLHLPLLISLFLLYLSLSPSPSFSFISLFSSLSSSCLSIPSACNHLGFYLSCTSLCGFVFPYPSLRLSISLAPSSSSSTVDKHPSRLLYSISASLCLSLLSTIVLPIFLSLHPLQISTPVDCSARYQPLCLSFTDSILLLFSCSFSHPSFDLGLISLAPTSSG